MNEIAQMKKQKPFIQMDEEFPCKTHIKFNIGERFEGL